MSENRCVCCGAIIPEGTQVCPKCTKEYWNHEAKVSRNARRGKRFEWIMNDWVFPLGLAAAIIVFILLVTRT